MSSTQIQPPAPAFAAFTYWQQIESLVSHFPHLNVLSNLGDPRMRAPHDAHPRHRDVGQIHCTDFYHDTARQRVWHALGSENWLTERPSEGFYALAKIDDADVKTRLIVVEDLSPMLIETLGALFKIDPELFASHLLGSGYSATASAQDPLSRWMTDGMARSYVSLEWFRPVGLNTMVSRWLKDSSSFSREGNTRSRNGTLRDRFARDPGLFLTETKTKYYPHGADDTEHSKTVSRIKTDHEIHISSNIFRDTWSLSAVLSDENPEQISTAWAERASIFKYTEASAPIVIILLDPRPSVRDSQEISEVRLTANPVPVRRFMNMRTENIDVPVIVSSRPRGSEILPPNKLETDAASIKVFVESNKHGYSTLEALRVWLDSAVPKSDPFDALVSLIQIDSINFLDELENCLREISKSSLNDYLMAKHLQDWRNLMNRLETLLPQMGRNALAFATYLYGDQIPQNILRQRHDLDTKISSLRRRAEKAYSDLRAEMAILESRRSIAEAETVTKLTELAFIFIPLTFCSGLFSMQVNELQNVPLRTFAITAVIVLLLCYGVRLVLRSMVFLESMDTAKERLWTANQLQPGSTIPTRLLILGTVREVWARGGIPIAYTVFFATLALTALPIAFLWVNIHMDSGLNATVTILLLPIGIALAWSFAAAYMEVRDEEDLPLLLRVALQFSGMTYTRRESVPSEISSSTSA